MGAIPVAVLEREMLCGTAGRRACMVAGCSLASASDDVIPGWNTRGAMSRMLASPSCRRAGPLLLYGSGRISDARVFHPLTGLGGILEGRRDHGL